MRDVCVPVGHAALQDKGVTEREIRECEMADSASRNSIESTTGEKQSSDDELTAECRAGCLSQIPPSLQQTFLPSASSLLLAAAAAASSARQHQ